MTIAYVILFFLALALIAKVFQLSKVSNARRRGIYPSKGKVSHDDVERLVGSGEHILAIRAYRELYRCSLRQAKRAVDDLK